VAGVQHPMPLMRAQTPVACSDGKAASRQHRVVPGRGQLPWLRGHAMSRAGTVPIGRLTTDWSGRRSQLGAEFNPCAAAAQSER